MDSDLYGTGDGTANGDTTCLSGNVSSFSAAERAEEYIMSHGSLFSGAIVQVPIAPRILS